MQILPITKIKFKIIRGTNHIERLQTELDKNGIGITVLGVFGPQYKNYAALPVKLSPIELYNYVDIIDDYKFI